MMPICTFNSFGLLGIESTQKNVSIVKASIVGCFKEFNVLMEELKLILN